MVVCSRQRHDDGKRDGGDDQLGVRDAQADHDSCESSRDDAGLPRPREEDDFLASPAPAAVREETGEDRERSRQQDEARDDQERGSEVVPDVAPRQVRAERDEDEHHHQVGDGAHETLACPAHGSNASRGEAGPCFQQRAPPGTRRDTHFRRQSRLRSSRPRRGQRRRLRPTLATLLRAGPRRRAKAGFRSRSRALSRYRGPRENRPSGPVTDASPVRTTPANTSASTAPCRVVQRRLGDGRLLDLLPNADAVEQRDEDRRIGRRKNGADQEPGRERHVEREGGDRAGDESRDDDARDCQVAQARQPHR